MNDNEGVYLALKPLTLHANVCGEAQSLELFTCRLDSELRMGLGLYGLGKVCTVAYTSYRLTSIANSHDFNRLMLSH